jgi:hypothetical protein
MCLPLKTWRIAGGGNRVGLLLANVIVTIGIIRSHVNAISYDTAKNFRFLNKFKDIKRLCKGRRAGRTNPAA